MPQRWAHLDCWHALENGYLRTLCGLDLGDQDPFDVRDEPRPGEQVCEVCRRILAGKDR